MLGPLTAEALEQAGLPLKPRPNGKWNIDKDKAVKESDAIEDSLDQQNADFVRAFYGLDRINPPLAHWGCLPSRAAPQDASPFNRNMREWLYGLTRSDHGGAGPLTAEALEQAGLPLKPRPDGKWNIDKDKATKEWELVADDLDQQNADRVRKFYGLDGKSPALANWGCLPSKGAPKDASVFYIKALDRLHYLTQSTRGARSREAKALEDAGMVLIATEQGGWSIDREATRAAYRARMNRSQVDGSSQGMGQVSIAASAGSSSYPVSSSGWDPAGQVGGLASGGGYPANPAPAGQHLPSNQGYAVSSAQAGPAAYAGPPSQQQAGRPSRRNQR